MTGGPRGGRLSNAAIARETGKVRMYRVKQDCFHRHVAAPQLTSLDPGNLRKWLAGRIANPDEAMETFEIRALRQPQLLAEKGMTGLDILPIDTEGYDAEIIRMIPFETLRPAVINFEILNLSKRDSESVSTLLMDHGYRLHESPMDCMAYHTSHTVLQ